jgi:predicted HAD superfamily Cof-like phosphohydrolase
MGVDLQPFFEEVHESNMTKFIDGRIGQDGKYLKGPNFRAPNLLPILKAQIAAAKERHAAKATEGGAL